MLNEPLLTKSDEYDLLATTSVTGLNLPIMLPSSGRRQMQTKHNEKKAQWNPSKTLTIQIIQSDESFHINL